MENLELTIKQLKGKIQRGNRKLKELDAAIVVAEKKYNETQKVVDKADLVMLQNDRVNLRAELFMASDKLKFLQKELDERNSQSQPQ